MSGHKILGFYCGGEPHRVENVSMTVEVRHHTGKRVVVDVQFDPRSGGVFNAAYRAAFQSLSGKASCASGAVKARVAPKYAQGETPPSGECSHCGATTLIPNGKPRDGIQIYRCKKCGGSSWGIINTEKQP